MLVHKLGAPGNPEFAIGSSRMKPVGRMSRIMPTPRRSEQGIYKKRSERQLEVIRQRGPIHSGTPTHRSIGTNSHSGGRWPGHWLDHDFGLACVKIEKTCRGYLRSAWTPPDTVEKVSATADRVVCLSQPINFHAVAQFYREFPQVTDEEAIAVLSAAGHLRKFPSGLELCDCMKVDGLGQAHDAIKR